MTLSPAAPSCIFPMRGALNAAALSLAVVAVVVTTVSGKEGEPSSLCPESVAPLSSNTTKTDWRYCKKFGDEVVAFWRIEGEDIIWRQECLTEGPEDEGWCSWAVGVSMQTARTYWGLPGGGDEYIVKSGHTAFGTDETPEYEENSEVTKVDGVIVMQFKRPLSIDNVNGDIIPDVATNFFVSWRGDGDENDRHEGSEFYLASFDPEDPNPSGGDSGGEGPSIWDDLNIPILAGVGGGACLLILVGVYFIRSSSSTYSGLNASGEPVETPAAKERKSNNSKASRGTASKGSKQTGGSKTSKTSKTGSKASKGSKNGAARMTQATRKSRGSKTSKTAKTSKGSKGSRGVAFAENMPRHGKK